MTETQNRLRLYRRIAVGMILTGVTVVFIGNAFGGFTSEMSAGFIGAGVVIFVQGIVSLLITIGESVVGTRRDHERKQ